MLTTTTTSGVTTTYGYDQNGDTTGISSTSGVSTNLSYDSQARLNAVKLADGTLVLMTYNAQGQRVGYSVSKNGVTSEAEQVTYRGDELAQAVISNTQRYTDTYLYDPTGAPLELIRQTKSGSSLSTARYWYVLNGHGDVVALTDISGTVVDSYSYDLWGKLGSAVEGVPQRLHYAGYWYDQELGWYWVAVRSYNPTLMRWLQPDPSQQDGVRTYVYVGDDPVDATDPSGLDQNPPPCTAYTSHTYCPPAPNPPPTGTPTPTAGSNTTRKAAVRTHHIAVAAIHPSIPPEVFWRWYSRITQAYIDKEGLQQADPHVNLRVQPLGGSKTDWDNWHIRLKSITSDGGEQATYTWEAEDSVTGRTVTAEGFGSDISEAAEQAKFALAERISEASQLPEADVPDFLNSLRGFAQAVESDVEAVSGDLGTALESLPPPP